MACTILTRLVETQLGWLIVRGAQMTLSVFDFSCNKKGKTRTRCCLVWRAKKLRQNNSNSNVFISNLRLGNNNQVLTGYNGFL